MCDAYTGVPFWLAALLPFVGALIGMFAMCLLVINRED